MGKIIVEVGSAVDVYACYCNEGDEAKANNLFTVSYCVSRTRSPKSAAQHWNIPNNGKDVRPAVFACQDFAQKIKFPSLPFSVLQGNIQSLSTPVSPIK
jgi:hypothetical protein